MENFIFNFSFTKTLIHVLENAIQNNDKFWNICSPPVFSFERIYPASITYNYVLLHDNFFDKYKNAMAFSLTYSDFPD